MATDQIAGAYVMAALFRVIEVETGYNRQVILGQRRDRDVVTARRVAWWVVRDMIPSMSTTWIGRQFSRDHTTVMDGLRNKERDLQEDAERARVYAAVLAKVRAITGGNEDMPQLPKPVLAPAAPGGKPGVKVSAARPGDVTPGGYIARDGAIICLP